MQIPEYSFDQNLREVLKDPAHAQKYVAFLRSQFKDADVDAQIQILGKLGVWLRLLDKLIEAEAALQAALNRAKGLTVRTPLKIQFAHVLQWQRRYFDADEIFRKVIESCETEDEAKPFLDFAWQHYGQSLFDQGKYKDALEAFSKANELRNQKDVSEELKQTTSHAIAETQRRLLIRE